MASVKDKLFAIATGDKDLGTQIVEVLNQQGAKAGLVDEMVLNECHGLIMIHSVENKEQTGAKQLFNLLKQSEMSHLEWVIALDDTPSKETNVVPEGFAGLIKALVHEYANVDFCSITVTNTLEKEELSKIVLQELAVESKYPEIVYEGKERFKVVPTIVNLSEEELSESTLALNPESVVLALGGAQGITPHLLSNFAKECPCHYVLVGRTAFNGVDEAHKDLETIEEIRQHLITVEGLKQPKEIEAQTKQIFKTKQIASSIALVEQNGGKVTYKKSRCNRSRRASSIDYGCKRRTWSN